MAQEENLSATLSVIKLQRFHSTLSVFIIQQALYSGFRSTYFAWTSYSSSSSESIQDGQRGTEEVGNLNVTFISGKFPIIAR